MNVVPLLVTCSLFLAGGAVVLFAWSVLRGDHEHADRLALLPLEEDSTSVPENPPHDDS